jgi:hypothetical protein
LATTTVVSYAAAVLGTAADYVAPGAPCFSPATGRMYFSNNGSEVGYVYYIDCSVPTPVLTNYAHSTGNRLQIKEGMIYIPNTGMMVDSFTASSDWACVREVGVGDSPASITSNPQYN